MREKGTCSCPLPVRNSLRVIHRSSSCCPTLRNRMTCTSHTSYDYVTLATQLYDERVRVLSKQFHVIECFLEHIVVEIVYDVLGHVQNGKLDEERIHHLSHRCIQLDADQILGIHGCFCYHVISVLLNDGLAFIPCCGKLHFIRFNPVSTNLPQVEFANNLYRFFSTVVLGIARFSLNMFTYQKMNGACLNRIM